MIFSDFLPLFLAQNFKTKILTAHKNLLLECLGNTGSVNYLDVLSEFYLTVTYYPLDELDNRIIKSKFTIVHISKPLKALFKGIIYLNLCQI